MSEPRLVAPNFRNKQIKEDFNRWIQKVNKEYFSLLKKHGVAEDLLFIGKKVSSQA